MISLVRSAAPPELDDTEKTKLTAEFTSTGESVWNKPYIKHALLQSSHSKCAYCEANIAEESKYMEVEHFRCKKHFPNLVVEWSNLLPSCKRCNGQKHEYNVEVEGMIVEPYTNTTSTHLYFHNYRLRWRDGLGRRTIDTLYLNDTERLVSVRMKIGESIAASLENIREKLEDYIATTERTSRRRNTIIRGMETLLKEAQPASQFSALAATVLLTDPNFEWVRQNLDGLELWQDLEPLYQTALAIALLP